MSLLQELNREFLDLHLAKESAFWSSRMDLKSKVPGDFETAEIKVTQFISDPAPLHKIRAELAKTDLPQDERTGLEGWKHFFEVNAIESPEAKRLTEKLIEMEGALGEKRGHMRAGYQDPSKGFVECSSSKMRLLMDSDPDEKVRKAAFDGMKEIENFVLANGFLDIIRERNRLGRLMGYQDFYDYKVSVREGFSKKKLFELLDELERDTRATCQATVDALVRDKGERAREPWQFSFYAAGDVTAALDPYFPFAKSVGIWGRSFMALGVRYSGSEMTLDLLARKGKFENGFMHGPVPAYVDHGKFLPAKIGFTSYAVPGQVGAGVQALKTLLHEGGHAAHFSNIRMPAPCFSQEFAPTSVAYAETQSMFMDSLMNDADWRARYARNDKGEAMPLQLIEQGIENDHRFRANMIRGMLGIVYAEKAIYEIPDAELTPTRVLERIRTEEARLNCLTESRRPALSVPHLISGESSAYYHGYVLAEMAVYQTREFFKKRDGHLMDNPKIGPDLQKHYWAPGNSRTFLEVVQSLTGEPFSGGAMVRAINQTIPDVIEAARHDVAREKKIPKFTGDVNLDATITLIHGDEKIGSTRDGSFDQMSNRFAEWIQRL